MRTPRLDGNCSARPDRPGRADCAMAPGVWGEVTVVATTTDADGNEARAVRSVWLAGDDDWWFGGDNGDRMDVIAEQPRYDAGDTAKFQVRMPFREATALVTVEREGVLSSFVRSEEHTSELQSLMRISYAVFCLKKKKHNKKSSHELATQHRQDLQLTRHKSRN